MKHECAEYEHLRNLMYQSWSKKKGLHKFEVTYEGNQENVQVCESFNSIPGEVVQRTELAAGLQDLCKTALQQDE